MIEFTVTLIEHFLLRPLPTTNCKRGMLDNLQPGLFYLMLASDWPKECTNVPYVFTLKLAKMHSLM